MTPFVLMQSKFAWTHCLPEVHLPDPSKDKANPVAFSSCEKLIGHQVRLACVRRKCPNIHDQIDGSRWVRKGEVEPSCELLQYVPR